MSRWRAHLFPWISFVYLILIYGLPTAGTLVLLELSGPLDLWVVLIVPPAWTMMFLIAAGVLSLPHQFAVTPGKLRRDVNNPLYFHRRLYGLCWTAVFYNKPVYYLCLTVPSLKWIVFRLFGYRGSMKFMIYPDTWIRDLPILKFEDGVYVSNRATLGTNMVLSNGFLLVGRITLRANSLVGHLAMLAPGVVLEAGAEVGVGAGIGIKTALEAGAFVGPCCTIEHGVRIGKNAVVGGHSYVGSGSEVCDGLRLPGGTVIAPRTTVRDGSRARILEPVSRVRARGSVRDVAGKKAAGHLVMRDDEILIAR